MEPDVRQASVLAAELIVRRQRLSGVVITVRLQKGEAMTRAARLTRLAAHSERSTPPPGRRFVISGRFTGASGATHIVGVVEGGVAHYTEEGSITY